MKKVLLFLLLFFISKYSFVNRLEATCQDGCCFGIKELSEKIERWLHTFEYEQKSRRMYFERKYNIKEWERPYIEQFKNLKAAMGWFSGPKRYPDVYHNILLYEQELVLVKDWKYEFYYQSYMAPGWAYSFEEKQKKISEQRTLIKNDFEHCKEVLYNCSDQITHAFIDYFEGCLKEGGSIKVYHDYGLLAYLNNNLDKSLDLLSQMVNLAEENDQLENLDAITYVSVKFSHLFS